MSGTDLSGANLSGANLSGANMSLTNLSFAYMSGANLSGVNLSGANMAGIDLSGTDLSGAFLTWTNLSGAKMSGAKISGADGKKTILKKPVVQITGLEWHIIIFDNDMRIACEYHSFKEWWSYDDDRIKGMYNNALDFWKQHKGMLQEICFATGRNT